MRFTPQLAALFAMGVLAAGIVAPASAPGLAVAVARARRGRAAAGAGRGHGFGLDDPELPLDRHRPGPGHRLPVRRRGHRPPQAVRRAAGHPPAARLGSFSYSLYLVHAPIVVATYHLIVADRLGHGVAAFAVTLGISVPLSIAFAWGFATIFEIPFQRHRSWAALRESWLFAAVRGGSARPTPTPPAAPSPTRPRRSGRPRSGGVASVPVGHPARPATSATRPDGRRSQASRRAPVPCVPATVVPVPPVGQIARARRPARPPRAPPPVGSPGYTPGSGTS